jgi:hypothetical protein
MPREPFTLRLKIAARTLPEIAARGPKPSDAGRFFSSTKSGDDAMFASTILRSDAIAPT